MLKVGVFGVGHLGKIHVKCLKGIEEYELVGFYDPDERNATYAESEFGLTQYEKDIDLIKEVDVVDIVTPTIYHFELAKKAIQLGKNVFIEKPVTATVEEAEELIRLAEEYKVKIQVGHVERFNPALLALDDFDLNPMFIEAHRLSMFNPRGTDVSVILDLMIHDLDIILHLVDSEVKDVYASGVAIVSNTPDICNARIEFENGCVANVTSSRLSMKQMRKIRIFQGDSYVSIDMLEKKSEVIRLYEEGDSALMDDEFMELDTATGKKFLKMFSPEVAPVNAIQYELNSFRLSIEEGTDVRVPLKDGYRALQLAHRILDEVNNRNSVLQNS